MKEHGLCHQLIVTVGLPFSVGHRKSVSTDCCGFRKKLPSSTAGKMLLYSDRLGVKNLSILIHTCSLLNSIIIISMIFSESFSSSCLPLALISLLHHMVDKACSYTQILLVKCLINIIIEDASVTFPNIGKAIISLMFLSSLN